MKITTILLLLNLMVGSFFAQENTAVAPTGLRKISTQIQAKDGFTAQFPSNPKRDVKQIETAFGKTDMITYSVSSQIAYYGISYFDFPSIIKDKEEVELRLRLAKDRILQRPGTKVVSEEAIMFGEYQGHDMIVEENGLSLFTRMLFVKQRFFQLVLVTNGSFTKLSAKSKALKKKTMDNFYGSLTIVSLPDVKSEEAEFPNNFDVKIENSVLTSGFFKFSINTPKNWYSLNDEEIALLSDLAVEESELKPVSQEIIKKSLTNTKFLVFLTKVNPLNELNDAVFSIAAEKVPFSNFLPSTTVMTFSKMFIEKDEKVAKIVNLEKINGQDFAWIEIHSTKDKSKQRLYVSNQKGIAFQVYFTYVKDEDLKVILESFKSIKFEN